MFVENLALTKLLKIVTRTSFRNIVSHVDVYTVFIPSQLNLNFHEKEKNQTAFGRKLIINKLNSNILEEGYRQVTLPPPKFKDSMEIRKILRGRSFVQLL